MPPPVSLNNSNHVHKISVSSPFYISDDSWPFLENNDIFIAIDRILGDFDANIFQQENSSMSKGGFDETHPRNNISSVPHEASANPCSLQEESILLNTEENILLNREETTNFEFNSHLEKENSSPIFEGLESLCPILEERISLLSSNKIHDTVASHDAIEILDPSIFLEQESPPLEPCIYGELQGQSLNNWSNCFEASDNSLQLLDQQETSALASPNIDERLLGDQQVIGNRKERKHKLKRVQIDQEKVVQCTEEDGSISKRQEHNAKEQARRKMLNTSYLSLGALLPADSRRKKKRRSAPAILDRALQYIPELEIEIEKLILRKKNLQSKTEDEQNPGQTPQLELQAPTVSVHEVVTGEVIVQITLILKDQDTIFPKLLENLEEEGRSIMSASTLQVCKERVSYSLHIQMNGSSLAADYVAVLREKIVSLLS